MGAPLTYLAYAAYQEDIFSRFDRHGKTHRMNQKRPTILLVDNDEAIISGVTEHLSSYADCLAATSFEEAISTLEGTGGIALVVTDIRLPGRDGFDLLLWLREHRPKVKVIMTTAYGSPAVRSLAKQQGAVMYLEKPYDPKQLMDTVQMILERTGFSVAIQDMEFTDLLQFLSFAGRAVKVQVTNNIGEEGEIGLQGDTVLWVRTGAQVGEEAFLEIVGWKGGGFEMKPLSKEEKGNKENEISLSYLLLEGARRQDEGLFSETKKEETLSKEHEEEPEVAEEHASRVRTITLLLEELEREIPDVIAAAVVSIDEGVPLAATTNDPAFDVDIVAAYYAEVIKTNEKALKALQKGPRLEEVLVTTDTFSLYVKPLPDTRFYVGLVIAQKGNVGMARTVMKRYEKKFLKTLPAD
jgi:DNA-binding response OmpR family regulator/predicted regulator of Ras-like GTPase activity (Roadblock/LC7/MglB family)